MFCNKTNADRVSLHQFPQTLDAGQYIWLLLQLSIVHCNILLCVAVQSGLLLQMH